MNCINKLIGLGFNFSVKDGHVSYEYRGQNPPNLIEVKPLLDELKQQKEQAIKYIESLIIYEIYDDINFDFQTQACLQAAYDKDIEWLRTDVYKKSRKVVLVGIMKKPEIVTIWHEVSKESKNYRDCPWVSERMVQ